MADSIEVTLTLGHDHLLKYDLSEHLESEIPGSGQSLDCIAGGDYNSKHLRGSGQAGTVRVYAGLIRRGSVDGTLEWLRDAPWGGRHAVVVIQDDHYDGPWVSFVDRNGVVTLRTPEMRL